MADDAPRLMGDFWALYRRRSLGYEDFLEYWREVHGRLVASGPGLQHYRQVTCDPFLDPDWPASRTEAGLLGRIDGFAELLFRTEEDRSAFYRANAMVDEVDSPLFLEPSVGVAVRFGGLRIHKGDGPEHLVSSRTVLVLSGDDDSGLVDALDREVLPELIRSDRTSFVRTVAGQIEGQSLVVLEVAFASELDRRALLNEMGPAFARLGERFGWEAYRVSAALTYVEDGRISQVGRRGPRAAALVRSLGALHLNDF